MKTNFHKLESGEKLRECKRGINIFIQFMRAVPDDFIATLCDENRAVIIEFLEEQLKRFKI